MNDEAVYRTAPATPGLLKRKKAQTVTRNKEQGTRNGCKGHRTNYLNPPNPNSHREQVLRQGQAEGRRNRASIQSSIMVNTFGWCSIWWMECWTDCEVHREVVCTVPRQGEGVGQQGRIKVVCGALTGPWVLMDLGFIVALLQRQDNVKICIKFPHTIKRQCIKTLICKLLEGN